MGPLSLILASSLLTTPMNQGPAIGSRVAVIDNSQPISGTNLGPINSWLMLHQKAGTKSVDLLINSPGGDVNGGLELITHMDAFKANGGDIRCFVYGNATSMAFWILTHCTKRYAVTNSHLLFHRVRVFYRGPVTGPMAKQLIVELDQIDARMLQDLDDALEMPLDTIQKHWDSETDWQALALDAAAPHFFVKVANSFPGLFEAVEDSSTIRMAPPMNILQLMFGAPPGGHGNGDNCPDSSVQPYQVTDTSAPFTGVN